MTLCPALPREKWDASLFPASRVAAIERPEIGKRPNFSRPTIAEDAYSDMVLAVARGTMKKGEITKFLQTASEDAT